jgi:hypothetical protein
MMILNAHFLLLCAGVIETNSVSEDEEGEAAWTEE